MAAAEQLVPRRRTVEGDRHRRAWTERELRILAWGWGTVCSSTLARRLKRTDRAVAVKASKLGLGGISQGRETVLGVARRLGYSAAVLHGLAKRLGLEFRRAPRVMPGRGLTARARRYALEEEQVDALEAELERLGYPSRPNVLPPSVWGNGGRPPACARCGRVDRPHRGRGLCNACYQASLVHGELERFGSLKAKREGE
jgi:hypothetical protein